MSLVAIVLLAVALRMPGASRPLTGPFATKNAIYAMIARNWASGRAPLWLPTIDCLAGGQRGLHLLELPLTSYLAGAGWAICGGSLDVWGRAVSIAFSLGGVALLYVLVRGWHGQRAAQAAALVLSLSPISVFCGQSFMLESSAVFFMLLALLSGERWLATASWRWWLLTASSVALMLCTKIYLAVMLVPLAWLALGKLGSCPRSQRGRWIAGWLMLIALGIGPAALWCLLVARVTAPEHPLAEHVYYSIWRSTTAHAVPSPLLWNAEFYWRFFKGLAASGLTPIGLLLAAIGLSHPAARRHLAWLAAMVLLVVLLPGKFFELRYYLLLLVPIGAVLAGLGYDRVARSATRMTTPRWLGQKLAAWKLPTINSCGRPAMPRWLPNRRGIAAIPLPLNRDSFGAALPQPPLAEMVPSLARHALAPRIALAGCLLGGFASAIWLAARPLCYKVPEDRAVTAAAAALRDVSFAGEPVATLHGAAPDLLYYCNRPGWALSANDPQFGQTLDRCRRQGARWLVVADLTALTGKPAAASISRLPVERTGDDYLICRLVPH